MGPRATGSIRRAVSSGLTPTSISYISTGASPRKVLAIMALTTSKAERVAIPLVEFAADIDTAPVAKGFKW